MTNSPYGFVGQWTDQNGLVHMGARYYNPPTGTFISPDPLEGDPRNPMSLNAYAYAHDNPINLTDPSGLSPIPNPGGSFGSRAGGMATASVPPVMGRPDPLATLNWINGVNSGCYAQQTPGANVHVPCDGAGVNARSHPSLYGRVVGSYPPGTVFTVCEERSDSPTTGLSRLGQSCSRS
ncbi:RHS repeat-associated core domain-containing protein [bacterium]|nr:RHS repeat-associated core domain-containing protein [bacterium]